MGHFDHFLPVVDNPEPEEELPSCSPKVYISNEEGALLSAMRDLREQSVKLRESLENSTPADRERWRPNSTSCGLSGENSPGAGSRHSSAR